MERCYYIIKFYDDRGESGFIIVDSHLIFDEFQKAAVQVLNDHLSKKIYSGGYLMTIYLNDVSEIKHQEYEFILQRFGSAYGIAESFEEQFINGLNKVYYCE